MSVLLAAACAVLAADVWTCPPRADIDIFAGPFYPAGVISVRDRNGDGVADILHLRYHELPGSPYVSLSLAVLLGNPNGTFGAVVESHPFLNVPMWDLIDLDATETDLNADGIGDVVVRSWDCKTLYYLQGLEDGLTFNWPAVRLLPPQKVFASNIAGRPFTGDFNGDGIQDVITNYQIVAGTRKRRNEIWVFLGRPNDLPDFRSYDISKYGAIGGAKCCSTAGDFDGDGFSDFAVDVPAGDSPNSGEIVAVFYGSSGDMTEGPPVDFGVRVGDLRAGDLNGDGFDDLIMNAELAEGTPFFIALSNGDRTFTIRRWNLSDFFPCLDDGNRRIRSLAYNISPLADLNGDGLLDFFTTGRFYTVLVLGDAEANFRVIPHNGSPKGLPYEAAYDIDGDTYVDLIGTGYASTCLEFTCSYLAVTYGNPELSFGIVPRFNPFMEYRGHKPPSNTVPLFYADDFDLDGAGDLLLLLQYGRYVKVFWGTGKPFSFTEGVKLPVRTIAGDLETGDMTGDGVPDIVYSDSGMGWIVLFESKAGRQFSRRLCAKGLPEPGPLAAEDFDGDALSDIAVVCRASEELVILKGKKSGYYESVQVLETGRDPVDITSGDFDGDARVDLAVLCSLGGSVRLFRGKGNGKFEEAGSYPVGYGAVLLRSGDFNEDGLSDLVVCNRTLGYVSVVPARSEGGFEQEIKWDIDFDPAWGKGATSTSVFNFALLDFNGDNHLDVAVIPPLYRAPGFCILFGDGAGRRAEVRWYLADRIMKTATSCWSPADSIGLEWLSSIVPYDWDNDGATDLAFYGRWGEAVFFLRNRSPCARKAVVFRRGEVNQDGKINVADVLSLLAASFAGAELQCSDAADANDDGKLNIADPIYLLQYLFRGGDPPPAPFPGCGEDPSTDPLKCLRFRSEACPENLKADFLED